jgi:hypothetical protein
MAAVLAGLVLGAVAAFIIDRNFKMAATYAFAGVCLIAALQVKRAPA